MRLETSQPSDVAGVVRSRSENPTVASAMHETGSEQEPPSKRIRVEEGTAPMGAERTTQPQNANIQNSKTSQYSHVHPTSENAGIGQSSVVTNSPVVSNSSRSSSTGSLHPPTSTKESVVPPPPPAPPAANQSVDTSQTMVPLKSTMMAHLRTKYRGELEYMLLEFRKLERQLLGAKGAAQMEESAGSRERREKLHSFILHLEDTIRQIEEGCRLEAGVFNTSSSMPPGKEGSTGTKSSISQLATPDTLAKRKEAEESVQKLEEHILANLLPVKVRLKKQLAAQQGATRNPAGMPAPRRGSYVASSSAGAKGTFAAAAEQRRKQAEAARLAAQQQQEQNIREVSDPTQFGTPLKGGSSLTRNLHGATLGSKQRTQGHGVGASTKENDEPGGGRVLYGGMVPESNQHRSGVAAASGVHDLIIESPSLMSPTESVDITEAPVAKSHPAPLVQASAPVELPTEKKILSHKPPAPKVDVAPVPPEQQPKPIPIRATKVHETRKQSCDKILTEDERRKMRKNRRKRKLLRLARRREKERLRLAATQPSHPTHVPVKVVGGGLKKTVLGKSNGRKKGPRAVEYICALCNDPYNSTCDYNPWWALGQQECPKCRKVQIPRIDITSPANQIEYHPALLAHIDDNGGNVGASASAVSQYLPKSHPPLPPHTRLTKPIQHPYREPLPPSSDSDSDLSELSDGSLSDLSVGSHDSEFDLSSLTPAEQAEHETFGHKYKGPILSEDHASRLLVLMQHSSTCPCKHKSKRHRDVCRSVKYMMLHVRDCPGTTSNFDVCPFPWCRKVKHLLYHLVSCTTPEQCKICSPTNLSPSLQALSGLNQFRAKKYRERLIMFMKRSAAARRAAVPLVYNDKKPGPQPPYVTPKGISKSNPAVYSKHSPPRSMPSSATARKGKKSGTQPTEAAPSSAYCKPISATSTARYPWTSTQGDDSKAPTKQTRVSMPQHVQSSKGIPPLVVGKTHPTGATNGGPLPPTYTSVEDPLRVSAAHRVQNPVQANISPVPKPAVPVVAASSRQRVHKAMAALPPVNAASNPVASLKSIGPIVTSVVQHGPSYPTASQSPHAPVARHLQPNSVAEMESKPVVSDSRDVTTASRLQGTVEETSLKAPVQKTLPTHQAIAEPVPSVGVAPTKSIVTTQKPADATSLPVAGHSNPIPSAQAPRVHGTRVEVEPTVIPALQAKGEAALELTAFHLPHPGQPARQPTEAATNLALVPDHRVMKVSTQAPSTFRTNSEKVSVSTELESAMIQQGTSPAVDSEPIGYCPVEPRTHVASTLHPVSTLSSIQATKQPTDGQVQAQTEPVTHSSTVTNSAAVVGKSVLESVIMSSHVTKAATVQPTAELLQAPSEVVDQSTPVAVPASVGPLSNASSSKYPESSAASSHHTREPDTERMQTRPTTSTTKPSTCSTVPPKPAQVTEKMLLPISSATETELIESRTKVNDVGDPVASAQVAKPPVARLAQSLESPAATAFEPLTDVSSDPPPETPTALTIVTKVSTSGPIEAHSKPAPGRHSTTAPPSSIAFTELQSSSSEVVKPPSAGPEETVPKTSTSLPKSGTVSAIVQTPLEAGRSVSPSRAGHGQARKVEQSADIVKVGG